MKERINELIKIINKASYEYYVMDNPTITDQEYDDYFNELLDIEKKYPELKREDSPTSRVGGLAIDKFEKVRHEKPMLSFDDIFNEEEIMAFDERIRKIVHNPTYTLEPKMDGLSGSLIYKNGILVRAATRGDGIVGEDITINAKTIRTIPLRLNKDIDIEVRGEIYMSKASFNKANKEREEKGLPLLANPRNAAAGSIRQLDSKITYKRELDFMAYFIPNPEDYGINYQSDSLKFLRELGFKTNYDLNKVAHSVKDIVNYIKDLGEKRPSLPFAIDGVVLKVDSLKEEKELGYTSRVPRWGIAYKFPAKEVLTELKEIKFTVGRTGKITPNAIFSPVHVDGSLISKATLHNEDYCISKDIRENDIISIRKAGDVIPEVVEVKLERRKEGLEPFKMITNCPICDSVLVKKDSHHFCPNKKCPARKIENLIHYASRNAMNIEGFGESVVEDFYNMGYLTKIYDFYNLDKYKDELMKLEGFGEKSISKLLTSIENSKNNSLERLIFALGIGHVGAKKAKILAKKYSSMDNLMNAIYDDLANTIDIGDVIANSIIDYFNDLENVNVINKLKEYNVNMLYSNEVTEIKEEFLDKKFVLTGSLESITREDATKYIEDHGGKVSSSVSAKTDVVIVGKDPGSKYDKALSLGITIWNEEEFLKYID